MRGGHAGDFSLLSAHGSLMLWEQALGRDAVEGFDLEQNAALARKSWNLALEYGLNLERLRAEVEGEDERRFARWTGRFEESRTAGDWLEPAALPQVLAQDLQTRAVATPERVFLLGFGTSQSAAAERAHRDLAGERRSDFRFAAVPGSRESMPGVLRNRGRGTQGRGRVGLPG